LLPAKWNQARIHRPRSPSNEQIGREECPDSERTVKGMSNDNLPIKQKLQEIVLRYRTIPLANGKARVELYMNRPFRIELDAMRPYLEKSLIKNSYSGHVPQK
ncbi:hypothetical protein ILUMI_17495, partial [Ignelater luminosus]